MKLPLSEFLTYLFFPRRCPFCNEVIHYSQDVCDSCKKNLPFIRGNLCKRCGCEKKFCKCGQSHQFDYAVSPFYYSKPYNYGLLKFKTNREKWRAKEFAKYMADCVRKRISEKIDFAVCVPDHKSRIDDNVKGPRLGYRVSPNATLSSAVCQELGIELKSDFLHFIKETTTRQQSLSFHGRKANVFGTIDVKGDYDKLIGKNILVIDDVLTTGSTVSECAKMLKLYGADKVFALTLFTTKQEKK